MKKYSLLVLAAAALLSSCVKEPGAEGVQTGQDTEKRDVYVAPDGSEWVKLRNPYTTENIQEAIETLGLMTRVPHDFTLTTHYHVRFRPANDYQFYALLADTLLEFFPYPLDYEVPEGEAVYVDPQQPAEAPPFLFTWVPIFYNFADSIAYDIIDPLCLVDDAGVNLFDAETAQDIVNASMSIDPDIGKYPMTRDPIQPGGGGGGGYSSNYPQGRIRAWDDLLAAYVPIHGAKVRARRWFKAASAATDINGNYVIKTYFDNAYNYSIIWETDSYDIRSGSIFQAIYNGPKRLGRWDLDIEGGRSLRFATIHRAAYRYSSGNTNGLAIPVTFGKIKIAYHDKEGDNNGYHSIWLTAILPQIHIYRANANGVRDTRDIFSTTVHEMAHAAHYAACGRDPFFWLGYNNIQESFARFVEWVITPLEYTDRGLNAAALNNLINTRSIQDWDGSNESQKNYSPLFIDLVDNINQRTVNGNTNLPNDNVTGYSISRVNSIVWDARSMSGLKSRIKDHKPTGITNAQINELFERYEEVWE